MADRSDWSVLHVRSGLKVFSGGADLAGIGTRFARPDKMVPHTDLEAEAKKIALRVAGLGACKVCIRLARDPERNGFAAETEWTSRLLATEETQRRIVDFLSRAKR